jgi:hypothetical protein
MALARPARCGAILARMGQVFGLILSLAAAVMAVLLLGEVAQDYAGIDAEGAHRRAQRGRPSLRGARRRHLAKRG